jgi:hypothetical protein
MSLVKDRPCFFRAVLLRAKTQYDAYPGVNVSRRIRSNRYWRPYLQVQCKLKRAIIGRWIEAISPTPQSASKSNTPCFFLLWVIELMNRLDKAQSKVAGRWDHLKCLFMDCVAQSPFLPPRLVAHFCGLVCDGNKENDGPEPRTWIGVRAEREFLQIEDFVRHGFCPYPRGSLCSRLGLNALRATTSTFPSPLA